MGYDENGDWTDDTGIDYNQWPGSDDSNDPLPSTQIGNGYIDPITGHPSWSSFGNIDWSKLAGQGGSAISRALQAASRSGAGTTAADFAKILGGFSKGAQVDRSLKGEFTQNYDKIALAAQAARNQNESDALKKLAQTSYITGGGSKFTPPQLDINGKHYNSPDLGYGPPPVSDAEKQGASALQPQLITRLGPHGSYEPQPLSGYADPGALENIGSFGAAGLSGLSAIQQMLASGQTPTGANGQQLTPEQIQSIQDSGGYYDATGSWVDMSQASGPTGSAGSPSGSNGPSSSGPSSVTQGLGYAGMGLSIASKAGLLGGAGASGGSAAGGLGGTLVPGLGAAAGIYGLSRNQNTAGNIASGTGAGASIGTMIMPGWGTAIGAGVGALYGALQSWLTVTEQEKQGRVAQGTAIKQLGSVATQQQKAEAASAHWPDPNQALGLIVMRDTFVKSGLSGPEAEKKAEGIMQAMWGAEGGGANDVADAFNPFSQVVRNQVRG